MRDQPPGWYRDRERPNLHRYWTGERWSERVGEELAVRQRTRVPEQMRADQHPDERLQERLENRLEHRACG
jgi:hypothetical protein